MKAYKTYIRPNIEYCVQLWNLTYKKDIECLESVQHRISRVPPYLRDLPYEIRIKNMNLESHQERRKRGDAIHAFKILNSNTDINKFYSPDINPRTRGHTKRLKHPTARIDIRKHCFSNRSSKIWNKLKKDIVESKTVIEFKRTYDKMLSSQDILPLNFN